jgi:N-acetylglucosaminyl-diphospho-decaprenol L-rhamnosyltransferase
VFLVSNETRVVAAIPNFNMAASLANLLPQVLKQGYDRVFVLDDGSTDDTVDVVRQFGDAVILVRSPRNLGAAANRNQILNHVRDDDLIHFIDADMDIAGVGNAAVARELAVRYAAMGVGVIGGLVRRLDGYQEPYNYGPVFSLRTNLGGGLPILIDRFRHQSRTARLLNSVAARSPRKWPRILDTPVAMETHWVHEGNMLVQARAFRSVHGYDGRMREHETQDFALKLRSLSIRTYFDPSIEVIHHHVDVRGKLRPKKQAEAAFYLLRKHGFRRYLTDR